MARYSPAIDRGHCHRQGLVLLDRTHQLNQDVGADERLAGGVESRDLEAVRLGAPLRVNAPAERVAASLRFDDGIVVQAAIARLGGVEARKGADRQPDHGGVHGDNKGEAGDE